MRYWTSLLMVLLSFVLSACSTGHGKSLPTPAQAGLQPIAERVYIESSASPVARQQLLATIQQAKQAVQRVYGSVQSRPYIHACLSTACYRTLGGDGSTAKTYAERIVLSPQGLNWHFLAHEWSHAEMIQRQTLLAWGRTPRWFDEGLAVVVSQAPEHSEAHWRDLVAKNIPRPSPPQLYSLVSQREWLAAVHQFGDSGYQHRGLQQEAISPLYTAAGHEVRPWLARVGTTGLLELIRRMNQGEHFVQVYALR